MSTLLQSAVLATSGIIRMRTGAALVKAASDIENEDPATPDHEARVTWAQSVLAGAALTEADKIMWRVALNPVLSVAGEDCADSDLQWVVNGLLEFLIR